MASMSLLFVVVFAVFSDDECKGRVNTRDKYKSVEVYIVCVYVSVRVCVF